MLDRPNAVVVVLLHLLVVWHTQIGNSGTDPKTKIGKVFQGLTHFSMMLNYATAV
jgi:hypothetical protein